MNPAPPILVAACGNRLAGADAFGPLVAEVLRQNPIPGVEILDLETRPAMLLDHLAGRDALVIVDAATGTGVPQGQLFESDWDAPDRPALAGQSALSSHGLSIADQIELARRLNILPAVVRLILLELGNADPRHPQLPGLESLRQQVNAAARRIARYAQSPP